MPSINTTFLPMKAHYLFFFAGISSVILYVPTYARQIGFSSVLVGTMYTILPIAGMASKPIMGAIADRFNCHKQLVMILLAITAGSWFCLKFVPEASGDVKGTFNCNAQLQSTITICSSEVPDKCSIFKLQNEHDKENNVVKCHVKCTETEELHQELCTVLNFTEYCNPKNLTLQNLDYKLDTSESSRKLSNNDSNDTMISLLNEGLLPTLAREEALNIYLSTQNVQWVLIDGHRCLSIPIQNIINSYSTQHVVNPQCLKTLNTTCKMECDSILLAKFYGNVSNEKLSENYRFWIFMLLMIAGWIGVASVTSLADTICFGLIADDSSASYGGQRLWGSVGWGCTSVCAGLLMDSFSSGKSEKNYGPVFYVVAGLLICDIVAAKTFKEKIKEKSKNFLGDIGKLFLEVRILVFVVWCITAGMFTALIGNFLFWYLEDMVDCSSASWIKTLEGLYVFIQGFFGELPFFFLNSYILKAIGHVNCMSLVLFIYGVMFFIYSVLPNPWFILPAGVLHGMTFSTYYATMTSNAAAVAAPGTEATVQGLVSAAFEGVGISVGSFISGIMFNYLDGRNVFRLSCAFALIMCTLHIIVQFFLNRKPSASETTNSKEQ